MSKLGIRAYLIVAVGTLAALPTLALSTVTAQRATAMETARADRESRSRAATLARELDALFAAQSGSVELLAAQVEAAGGLDAPHLPELLRRHREHAKLAFAYLADRDGTSRFSDPPVDATGAPTAGTSYRDRDYYRELMRTGQTAISQVQLGRRSGEPNVQVAAPIRDHTGAVIGYAEGSIDLRGIAGAIAHARTGDAALRIVVTDARARVLADTAGHLAPLADAARSPLLSPAATAVDDVYTARDEDGHEVRVARAAMQRPLGFTVTAVREQSDVAALARAARRDALIVTAIALAGAMLLVWFGVSWLSRPIRQLAAISQAVGRGDLAQPVPRPRRLEPRELAALLGSVRDMVRDVREHRAETSALISELETANDQLRTMVVGIQHAGNAIEVVDADGRLTYVNLAWERFTGYTAAEALGRSFREMLAPAGELPDPDMWARLVAGEPWHGIYASRHRDGHRIDVELDAVPVTRADGAFSHVVVTRIDLTAQRRTEEVLRMNDRLAAVGTLAAGVAHEINNPLTYVNANLDYLRGMLESGDAQLPGSERAAAIAALDETALGVSRVATIVRDLKQLARPDERTGGEVDLNALVASCVRMAQVDIRHRARVSCDYGELPPIAGNEARLSQVFLNLLINAAQACSAAGGGEHEIRVVTRHADVDRITVEISDTGKGIPPEIREHIFDPFFTTKPIGVGTGLGLSICRRIVNQLGGEIAATSAPGGGATFRVELPVHRAVAPRAPATAPPKRLPTAPIAMPITSPRLRVLIVDDEPRIAKSLARMLRQHDVTVAESATHALAILDEAAPFDLVLSDVMMPDLDGVELYQRTVAAHPRYARAFIFMTGGIVKPHLQDELDALRAPCLYKPFSLPQVLGAIAALAEQNARRATTTTTTTTTTTRAAAG